MKYNKHSSLYVEFQDEYKFIKHTNYSACIKGGVRNPFDKTVCGIGYYGVDEDGNPISLKNNTLRREYDLWSSMIKRCYTDNYPAWNDCNVCESWLCFANFLRDLPLIRNYDLWKNSKRGTHEVHLDKDIYGNGQKLYSLENCCFVAGSQNAKERIARCGNPNKEKPVIGINMETGESFEFDGIRKAQRAINAKNHNGICGCCNGKQKYAYGYYWHYKDN